jgi:Skp family chaperone for outer membrane proteins
MTKKLSAALFCGVIAAVSAQPAFAQAAASSGPIIPGLAIADFDAVLASTAANRTAATQRQTTYKTQIDAYEARRQALQNQLQPLATKLENDAKAAKPNQSALQQQANQLRQLQESGQQELNRLAQPIAYSQAYVAEQIEAKLDEAVKAAMAKKRVSIVLTPQAIMAVNNNAYNLNPDILAELDRLIPTAQLVPPAGWEPRQIREARQAQAGATAAPATPAGPQPTGR